MLKNELNVKEYYELKKQIFENEYNNTISGDWAYNNETVERKLFNSLSDENKHFYAIIHSKNYTEKIMDTDLKTLTRETDYFDLLEDIDFIAESVASYQEELETETENVINSKYTLGEIGFLSDKQFEEIHMISQDLATENLRKKYEKLYKDYLGYVENNINFEDCLPLSDYTSLIEREKIQKAYSKIEKMIELNKEITLYTNEEIIKVIPSECMHISFYENWNDLCDEWLNTGVPLNDECYRHTDDIKQMEQDKHSYYDYKKGLWFVVE